eukprot:Skav226330  [mRNA]  locus=scaffold4486:56674:61753:+ [translate_table: standard]
MGALPGRTPVSPSVQMEVVLLRLSPNVSNQEEQSKQSIDAPEKGHDEAHNPICQRGAHPSSSAGKGRYPSLAFERWWYSAMSFTSADDPLLPVPESAEDPALLADLEQVGFTAAEAKQMIRRLHSSSAAAARNLGKMAKDGTISLPVEAPNISNMVGTM